MAASTVTEIDGEKVESWFHQIAPNMTALLVRIILVILVWFIGRKVIRVVSGWINRLLTGKNNQQYCGEAGQRCDPDGFVCDFDFFSGSGAGDSFDVFFCPSGHSGSGRGPGSAGIFEKLGRRQC